MNKLEIRSFIWNTLLLSIMIKIINYVLNFIRMSINLLWKFSSLINKKKKKKTRKLFPLACLLKTKDGLLQYSVKLN